MKKKFFHKAVSILMACAVAVSATVTSVFAADPAESDPKYTITIKGTDNVQFDGEANYKFEAYQLLDGIVEKENGKYLLTNIKWGSGFETGKVEEFLDTLSKNAAFNVIETDDSGTEITKNAFDGVETAVELAKALQDKINDSDFMLEFARIAEKYMQVPTGTGKMTDEGYVIDLSDSQGGYYLIKDKTEVNKDDGDAYALSTPILRVLGEEEVEIKSDIPYLEKKITLVNGTDDNVAAGNKSAAASVGSTVSFELLGTLPSKFSSYETYFYQFEDTLPAGLTLKEDSIMVEVKIGSTYYKVDATTTTTDNVYYTVSDNKLTVGFNDLKKVTQGYELTNGTVASDASTIKVNKDTVVVVYYETIVNAAAVSAEEIENVAELTFSNDPSNSGAGDTDKVDKTPKKKAKVVVFEIDMDKNNGDGNKVLNLSGVGFTITDGKGKTAIFHQDSDGTYTFVAWTQDPLADWLKVDDNKQLLKDIFGDDALDDTDVYVTEVETGSAAYGDKNLVLKGLAPADYVFSETTPKAGYVAVESFTVTLVAEVKWSIEYVDKETGKVPGTASKIGCEADGYKINDDYDDDNKITDVSFDYTGNLYYNTVKNEKDEDVATVGGTFVTDTEAAASNGDKVKLTSTAADKSADLSVIDDLKTGLPSTGGSGVWFYYICGGVLVIAGIALLVFAKKKSGKKA